MKTQKYFARSILFGAAFVLILSRASAQNLVVNGNFSAGNTGFTSSFTSAIDLIPESTYAIGANPASFHDNTYSPGDHTSGTGNLMIVNPGSNASDVAWQQTVTVSPFTAYTLTVWTMGWYQFDSSPANLQLKINSTGVGANQLVPGPTNPWISFGGIWNSGAATSATIQIFDLNTALAGNDFVLDDISLTAVPEPGTLTLMLGAAGLLLTAIARGKVLGRRVIQRESGLSLS